ncbi:4-hydroxy-tetrahydrodipicolinate synthase [Luteibaculum oceani]|uniref:4-hydroxy-tetrahydrodipicolinate synthase n=1 Tax=Luteibaculum oceani TaxID=1294296 RepID=A0A5C6UZS8_9FLAO|nr:4-hydroxy-tetrahydrodipicolinate synthase [Luteibaculum oceani]TXC76155.1 4-hydroxy-tetrahydrodipicolinate synthase [Luteibaculum oceani]
MDGSIFKGLGVAMVTPFKADGSVDFEGLKNLTSHLVDAHTEYLVVMGTTGESATLTKEEKLEVLETVKSVAKGKSKIVWGCGGNNTAVVAKEIAGVEKLGVDGILSVSPAYNKPTQEGIYMHYATLAKATSLPIILYNVPGRTASNMLAETTLKLAIDFSNIVAIKEASGNLEQIGDIIKAKPDHFEVISGDDGLSLPILAMGGIGVISVVGNAFPTEFREMIHATINSDLELARERHYQLHNMMQLLFKEGNPGGIKEALRLKGICENYVRLPLVPVSKSLSDKIRENILSEAL